ncbi:MAG: DUF402 domain-containing protein [Chloroflexi bacterium]|nr:DUF402 domain-containing protein [Chloroflexota bacterium]
MSFTRPWSPGDHVLLREVLNCKVLSARPQIVVEDTPDLLALWLPPRTIWMKPDGRDDPVGGRLAGDWNISPIAWDGEGLLRLTKPGALYSVLVLWSHGREAVDRWYINLEDPLRRTSFGFEFLDQLLDIVVAGDRQSWRWKDEDEFECAVKAGLLTRQLADGFRRAADDALTAVLGRVPPFEDHWATWSPDPAWVLPRLPDGWDRL